MISDCDCDCETSSVEVQQQVWLKLNVLRQWCMMA